MLQSPKEPGSKTATPLSTTTPKVDVAFQERKNQTELENVLSVTSVSTPAQAASLATTSTGSPGTPVSMHAVGEDPVHAFQVCPPCQSTAFAGLGTFIYKACHTLCALLACLSFLVCRPVYYF